VGTQVLKMAEFAGVLGVQNYEKLGKACWWIF
jgi:hypothetical protein